MCAIAVHPIRRIAAATLAGFVVGVMLLTLCGRAAADAIVFEGPVPAAAGIEQQLRGQLEPLLKVELSFVNRVCRLDHDQRRTVIAESKKWFDEFVADYAKKGGQMMGGGNLVLPGAIRGRRQAMEDPRVLIQSGVANIVQECLPAEQSALYQEESRQRDEFQRTVAVENLVARIADKLMLSPEQRGEVNESLSEHWDKSWGPQLDVFMHQPNMWPDVPDPLIVPYLSAAQQTTWKRLNKQSAAMFFGGVGWMNGQVIDDIDLDEAADDAVERVSN